MKFLSITSTQCGISILWGIAGLVMLQGAGLITSDVMGGSDKSASTLFSDLPADTPIKLRQAAEDYNKATARRRRTVNIDWETFAKAAQGMQPIRLDLFPDVSLQFSPERFKALQPYRGPGGTARRSELVGRISKDPTSDAVFILREDDRVVAGTIRTRGRIFEIKPVGGGVHVILEIDPTKFVPELNPKSLDRNPGRRGSLWPHELPESQSIRVAVIPYESPESITQLAQTSGSNCKLDVLVVYTPAASQAAYNDIGLAIDTAVAEANTSYRNSDVNTELELVFVSEIQHTEQGIATDWSLLQGSNDVSTDRVMNTVHTWRNDPAIHADLVSLWVEYGGGPCGLSEVATDYPDPPNHAFSVVRRECAGNFLSFAHELGHGMGAKHDHNSCRTDGCDNGGYNYGHAHAWQCEETIMSQVWGVTSTGTCRRAAWSHPMKFYSDGTPMGMASPSVDAADNHRTLNENRRKISDYRSPGCVTDTAPPSAPKGLRIS